MQKSLAVSLSVSRPTYL